MQIRFVITAFFTGVSLQASSQIYLSGNGLSSSGSGGSTTVSLGGTLVNSPTNIDFGSGNANSSLLLKKGTANYFSILNGGNVGIGISSPAYKLHVSGTGEIESLIETTDDGFANLTLKSNNKSYCWSKRPTTSGDNLELYYHDGTAWKFPAYMRVNPNGNFNFQPNTLHGFLRMQSGTVNAGSVIFEFADHPDIANTSYAYIGLSNHTDWAAPISSMSIVSTNNGTKTTKDIMMWANDAPTAANVALTIKANTGNIGIGTANPQAKLAVNGDIFSKKVKVTQSGWPDYVFHSSYSLRPLSEVEDFIRKFQRLPDVPSASEVEKDGLDVGDNQAVLLKKIEELTLYLLQQEKKLEELKAEVKALKANKR